MSTGGGEAIGKEGLDAHAGLRESGDVLVSPVRLLHVFAQGELDARGRFGKEHFVRGDPEPKLDHGILPADWVCGAM